MTIEVGSFVIINEVDAPVCRLVAQVTDIKMHRSIGTVQQIVYARYVAKYPFMPICSAELERVTLVSDFGVEVIVTENYVLCEKQRESIVKYADGSIGEWQDHRKIAREPIRNNHRKGESK